jgi:hypothetical protein
VKVSVTTEINVVVSSGGIDIEDEDDVKSKKELANEYTSLFSAATGGME